MVLGRRRVGLWIRPPVETTPIRTGQTLIVRRVLLLATVALLSSGCSVKVRLSPKVVPPETAIGGNARVPVAPAAVGVPETIAHETVTLFAIPAIAVKLSDPQRGTELMNGVREALRQAGYEPVPAGEGQGKPVLECRVLEMYFKNYTYFLPLVKTWGRVRLQLALVNDKGAIEWQREYAEEFDETDSGMNGFQSALNLTVGKILTRAAADFSQPDFKQACCGVGTH